MVPRILLMNTGNPDNPNATKKARKTAGATQVKAIGKLIGVEAITVMKRDTMRISPDTGVTRIAPDITLTNANPGGTMIIQEKGRATHPMKNIKIKFVIFLGNLLKRKKQEGIGAKISKN